MRKELKIGIIMVVTLGALIWGINFLKGRNFFSNTINYCVIYEDVSGLMKSNGVYIKGYKVGHVANIGFSDNTLTMLRVDLAINSDINIPKGTRAKIYNLDLIGNKAVELIFSSSKEYSKQNDTILGDIEITIAKQLEPYKVQAYNLLLSADSLSNTIISLFDQNTIRSFKQSMKNVELISGSLNSGTDEILNTLTYTQEVARNLSENSKRINEMVKNLEMFSKSLNQLKLAQTAEKTDSVLTGTLEIIQALQQGKGSMGQLLTNDSLYRNLDTSIRNLDSLISDLQKNPNRYVHFSIFGKKK